MYTAKHRQRKMGDSARLFDGLQDWTKLPNFGIRCGKNNSCFLRTNFAYQRYWEAIGAMQNMVRGPVSRRSTTRFLRMTGTVLSHLFSWIRMTHDDTYWPQWDVFWCMSGGFLRDFVFLMFFWGWKRHSTGNSRSQLLSPGEELEQYQIIDFGWFHRNAPGWKRCKSILPSHPEDKAAKWLDGALMGITFDAAGNKERRNVDPPWETFMACHWTPM